VQANWTVAPVDLGFTRVPGSVSLDISLSKLLEFGSQSFPTSEVRENKGTLARFGLYDYRALTTLRYAVSEVSIALTWRRLPSIRNASYVTDPQTPFEGARSYNGFDLAGSWNVSRTFHLTLGIDNLLDRDPNRVGAGPANNGAGNTMAGFYDVLGRRYYAGVRLRF
jgi:outer membrane receptor for ferrienterochelin and colicin